MQNVVGGAAYQVLLAQMAGAKRLVEANAKVALGETSAALVGPGLAGGLIQLLTAPFAILLDALAFFASALLLRRIHVPQRRAGTRAAALGRRRDPRRVEARLAQPDAARRSRGWPALWQILHHMQIAVLILFATRELGLSAGAIGITYMFGGLGCVLAVGVRGAAVGALRRRAR